MIGTHLSDEMNLVKRVSLSSMPKWRRVLRQPLREVLAMSARLAARFSHVTVPANATTFWGGRMHVMLPEPVSEAIFRYGFFEEGLTAILLRMLGPGVTYFDVGAHMGYHTLLASHLVGPSGTVCAFEPTPSTCRILRMNTRAIANIRVFQNAIHETSGELMLSDFGTQYSAFNSLLAPRLSVLERDGLNETKHRVRTWSIDDFVAREGIIPSFVKIDAESAEHAILRGMVLTLERHRPMVTVEVGDLDVPGAEHSRAILDFMHERGYLAFQYKDGRIERHEPVSRYNYDNLLFAADDRPLDRN